MFCGKCGQKLQDSAVICTSCGWRVPGRVFTREAPRTAEDNVRPQPADEDAPSPYPDEGAQAQYLDNGVRSQYFDDGVQSRYFENDVRSRYFETEVRPHFVDGPGDPPYGGDNGRTRAADPEPPAYYQPPVYGSRQGESGGTGAGRQTNKPDNTRLIIGLIVVVSLLICVSGFFTFRMIYQSTDGYKQARAEEQILNAQYDEALSSISDVKTEQADALRQFAALMRKRDAFLEAFKADELQAAGDPVKERYDALSKAYSDFHSADLLPEKLRERCDNFEARLAEMSASMTQLTPDDLTDAQRGVLTYGQRKRGSQFTIYELDSIINLTEPVINTMQTELIESEGFKALREHSDAAAVKATDEFYLAVANQLGQDKFNVESYRKEKKNNEVLRLEVKDVNYRASVGDRLRTLTSDEDADWNARTLYTALCYAWMAYAYE